MTIFMLVAGVATADEYDEYRSCCHLLMTVTYDTKTVTNHYRCDDETTFVEAINVNDPPNTVALYDADYQMFYNRGVNEPRGVMNVNEVIDPFELSELLADGAERQEMMIETPSPFGRLDNTRQWSEARLTGEMVTYAGISFLVADWTVSTDLGRGIREDKGLILIDTERGLILKDWDTTTFAGRTILEDIHDIVDVALVEDADPQQEENTSECSLLISSISPNSLRETIHDNL